MLRVVVIQSDQWFEPSPITFFCIKTYDKTSYWPNMVKLHTYRLPIQINNYKRCCHNQNNHLPDFLYKGTWFTIQKGWNNSRVLGDKRGVRELQRGRALLSRLKAERGCQQASNELLSLQRESTKWRQARPASFLQWIAQLPPKCLKMHNDVCFKTTPQLGHVLSNIIYHYKTGLTLANVHLFPSKNKSIGI